MDSVDSNSKIAIVTGSSKGIGAEIVKVLSKNGYFVVLNYNNSNVEAKEIANDYDNITIFKADVSKYEEAQSLVNFAINKFGRIDLLVNNAGIDLFKTLTEISNEEFQNIMKVNLYSAFYMSKEVAKYMISQKSGSIINISSIWGLTGASCEMPYSVSKAGLDAMTKSLAKELGPSNIRVNSIAPGFIDTDMNNFLSDEEKNNIVDEIPLYRIGKPLDVANCVLMLEKCDYITGQIIPVTGGWYI